MNINSTINETASLPSVAIVILNWNGVGFLANFLPSVMATTYKNIEIIVADNASTDDSISFLQTNYPTIKIILNPINEGFAKGYNTALKQVNADYFVLLNSDVAVAPNWIEPIITLMEGDATIAACQPKILDYKNKQQFEYAGACGGWIDSLGYPFARGRVLENIETDTGQFNDAAPCFWATGAAMFVRANVFNILKGFDEYFFAHQEEIDLCWRMQLSGYKVFVQPASVVYHVGGGTLQRGNNKKTYLNFRNNLIMLYKNTPLLKLLIKLPIRFSLDAIAAYKGLLSGDAGYFITIAKAHFHFMGWWLFHQQKSNFTKATHSNLHGYFSGSIIYNYFIKGKKTFLENVENIELRKTVIIYIQLLEEGSIAYRPVKSFQITHNTFEVGKKGMKMEEEIWEFATGTLVECELKQLSNKKVLVAIKSLDVEKLDFL